MNAKFDLLPNAKNTSSNGLSTIKRLSRSAGTSTSSRKSNSTRSNAHDRSDRRRTRSTSTLVSFQIYSQFDRFRVQSFHLAIDNKTECLLYYPVYLITYRYAGQTQFTCLVDGVTGRVTGDRQYSFVKVTLFGLVAFYPAMYTALFAVGSMIDPSMGEAVASSLSFRHSLPLAVVVAPLLGLYATRHPTFYRQRIDKQQWESYRSTCRDFTYDFTSPFEHQYKSHREERCVRDTKGRSRHFVWFQWPHASQPANSQ
jgi:hypothetical protein